MVSAPLGDDVLGDDPTVNRLEELAAERMSKESALFVASGTMGNLIGMLISAGPGQEVVADADSHIFMYEAAGSAMVGGIQLRQIATERGVMTAQQVESALRPASDDHQPQSAAIVIENTHNRHGGVAWPLQDLRSLGQAAKRNSVAVHMDGARIFNAALAVGADVSELADVADTITFCLSKGLSCPAGSILCGPAAKIQQARRWRKMLGGGMRQAGVLAAAGLVALDTMIGRLADDHENARRLAEGLADMPGVECDLSRIETNIVYFRLTDQNSSQFLASCAQQGLLGSGPYPDQVRFVTHSGISPGDIRKALAICRKVLCS